MSTLELPRVDTSSPVPRYVQAKTILAEAIRNGAFAPGSKLPNTSEIGAAINVSLITAHKAIQCLVEEGWVRRERGRGTFVRGDFEASVAAKPRFRVAVTLHPSTELDDFYHGAVMAGIQEAAEESSTVGEIVIQRRDLAKNSFATIDTDAVLCFHPYQDSFAQLEEEARNRPIVVLGGSLLGTRLNCVDSQNFEGMRNAVRHLIERGHVRIAIVNGPLAAPNCLHRFQGYVAELQAHNIPLRDEYIFNADVAKSAGAVLRRLADVLRQPQRPTAVVSCGYYLALDVMALVRELNLSIPGDVSLIAFDDPKSSSLLDPPLTTVRQPLKEMGKLAYERVVQLVRGEKPTRLVELLPTTLIVRQSTAPVK